MPICDTVILCSGVDVNVHVVAYLLRNKMLWCVMLSPHGCQCICWSSYLKVLWWWWRVRKSTLLWSS